MRHLLPVLLLAGLVASPARASSVFPSILREESGAARTPTCVVCHENNNGGFGTAIKPFSQALEARGMGGAAQTGPLRAAFQRLEEDGVDSDMDGTIDFDEIFLFRDPNIALTDTVDDCLVPGQCAHDDGDGGGTGDGGVTPVPEAPEPLYGVGCTSVGGMQALGGLLLLSAFGLRHLRRRR